MSLSKSGMWGQGKKESWRFTLPRAWLEIVLFPPCCRCKFWAPGVLSEVLA